MSDPYGASSGVPRWLKLSVIIAVLLVLVVVGLMFLLGGEHGPSRHAPSGENQPSEVSNLGGPADHTPPAGGHD